MQGGMSLKKNSLIRLTSNKSKSQMAEYIAEGLLEEYRVNKDVRLVMTHSRTRSVNKPHILQQDFSTHRHEEADI